MDLFESTENTFEAIAREWFGLFSPKCVAVDCFERFDSCYLCTIITVIACT